MDKRWIYIIIILIIGVSALYSIASSSNTIGSATLDVSTFVITLPDQFHIDQAENNMAALINRDTNEKLIITDSGKGDSVDSNIQDTMKKFKKINSVEIENNTITYKNITIKTVYMIFDDGTINSTTYFMKFNHTFNINANNFNDKESILDNIKFLIDSLERDYKQTQD